MIQDLPISMDPKGVLILVGGFLLWGCWKLGLFSTSHMTSPLPTHGLQRKAYGVVMRAFQLEAPTVAGSPEVKRAAQRAHRRNLVRKVRRSGRWATYVQLRLPVGADVSEGSKGRLLFERLWRKTMTRPDAAGEATHDWEFVYYTGSSTVLARVAPLTPPEVTRLFEHLEPFFKWPDGTRPADVIEVHRG